MRPSSRTQFSSYGEENKKFLQAFGRNYDPEGIFQKKVSGGFKLSE